MMGYILMCSSPLDPNTHTLPNDVFGQYHFFFFNLITLTVKHAMIAEMKTFKSQPL